MTRIATLQNLEASIPASQTKIKNKSAILAVGSEETGHNITTAFITPPNQKEMLIYSGNGLKSALNTFSATEHLAKTLSPQKYIQSVRQPFAPGFKSTLYAYYVCQELFSRDSQAWRKIKQLILKTAKQNGYSAKTQNFPDDPDMLYISLTGAGIFVRNSGTENKISVNLRGRKSDAGKLKKIGSEVIKLLLSLLKDPDNLFYKIELYALSQIACKPISDQELEIKKQVRSRLINEMRKQNLIRLSPEGNRLTSLGKWYINH